MRRTEVLARLPMVLGYSREEAAAAIGVSATMFDDLVRDSVMPAPRMLKSRRVWDVDELRASFKALPRPDESDEEADSWAGV